MNSRALIPLLLTPLLIATSAQATPSAPITQAPSLIPQPVRAELSTGTPGFSLAHGISLDTSISRTPLGQTAIRALKAAGLTVRVVETGGELILRQARGTAPEWYSLSVTPEHISITVNDPKALHLAAQTLAQATVTDSNGQAALPAMEIEDEPLMGYRGLLVDVGRYFRTKDEMKQIIRLMARYKLNRLHWHLTEDMGWRLEIKQYPKLVSIGSHRPGSWDPTTRDHINSIPESGYYSQEDVRELVAYAHDRGIIIIPEIEVPGHSSALLAAYPELGNSDIADYKPEVSCRIGVHDYVMAPKPETFHFLQNVFREVCELFPDSPYIHIGGDEAPRTQWKASPSAQQFMKANGLASEDGIQHYFTRFCLRELAKYQRQIIGWDEIQQDSDLPPSAIIMIWRDLKLAYPALNAGHQVILSPLPQFYFDFGQGKFPKDPSYRGINNTWECDWQFVYDFDPNLPGLTPEQSRRILGIQGNLWGEYTHTLNKFHYMLIPRLCALAEVAWLPKQQRNKDDFLQRLQGQYDYFDREKLNFREEDGTPRLDRGAMSRETPAQP